MNACLHLLCSPARDADGFELHLLTHLRQCRAGLQCDGNVYGARIITEWPRRPRRVKRFRGASFLVFKVIEYVDPKRIKYGSDTTATAPFEIAQATPDSQELHI
jgi:hypothetical protein